MITNALNILKKEKKIKINNVSFVLKFDVYKSH